MKQSNFFEDVHQVVRLIPVGRITSYGAIGEYLGIRSSARMVGWAMNQAHVDNSIPAHRVVNRSGLLTGRLRFETPTTMEELLLKEGIKVIDNQVVDFKTLFWDPSKEL